MAKEKSWAIWNFITQSWDWYFPQPDLFDDKEEEDSHKGNTQEPVRTGHPISTPEAYPAVEDQGDV